MSDTNPESLPILRRKRGCDAPTRFPLEYPLDLINEDQVDMYRCPWTQVRLEHFEIVRLASEYNALGNGAFDLGNLPYITVQGILTCLPILQRASMKQDGNKT